MLQAFDDGGGGGGGSMFFRCLSKVLGMLV